jgi:hypothetical protein
MKNLSGLRNITQKLAMVSAALSLVQRWVATHQNAAAMHHIDAII